MQNRDTYLKVVLTLLTIGVWGLLLRPGVLDTPVLAQKGVATARKTYVIVSVDKENRLRFDAPIGADMTLEVEKLEEALREGVKRGFRVHTILPHHFGTIRTYGTGLTNGWSQQWTDVKGDSYTRYVLILER